MGLTTGAGVRVLRCSYVNSLLLPVALVKFRVWEPLLRKPPASGVEPVAPWLDKLFVRAAGARGGLGRRQPRSPIGPVPDPHR